MSALLLLAASLACAAPAAAPAKGVSQATADWLKLYPLAPYREAWASTVEVSDLKAALPKIMKAVEKRGGTLLVPLANSVASASEGTQQLSYRLLKKDADAAMKDVAKLGKPAPPVVSAAGEKAPLDEIKKKIADLSADKAAHAKELASMPAVSGLVESVLAHLVTAKDIAEKGQAEVLLYLTLQQKK